MKNPTICILRPAKTQISLCICLVRLVFACALFIAMGIGFLYADSEYSVQAGWMLEGDLSLGWTPGPNHWLRHIAAHISFSNLNKKSLTYFFTVDK